LKIVFFVKDKASVTHLDEYALIGGKPIPMFYWKDKTKILLQSYYTRVLVASSKQG